MSVDRFTEFIRAAPRQTGVSFLAHEDVALKASFETRARYLGSLAASKAFGRGLTDSPALTWDPLVASVLSHPRGGLLDRALGDALPLRATSTVIPRRGVSPSQVPPTSSVRGGLAAARTRVALPSQARQGHPR
jgi:hypothetical protein